MINLFVALSEPVYAVLKQYKDNVDSLNEDQKAQLDSMTSHGDWERVSKLINTYTNPETNVTYYGYSIYFNYKAGVSEQLIADWVTEFGLENVVIAGAWHFDTGLLWGLSHTYDEDGEVSGVEGTALFPTHPLLIAFMPDVVTYDDEGMETSREAATILTDVNLMSGQATRVF